MDRRMGMESMMGYTKGLLSPASAKLETRGQEFKRAGQNERACEAFLSALDKDPANCDAAIAMIPYLRGAREDCMPTLKTALTAAKARLEKLNGENFFLSEDQGGSAGHFWGLLDTRPYMRLQSSVAEMARVSGDFAAACEGNLECLRLCPGDNMGQRSTTVPLLLKAGRSMDAVKFCLNWLLMSNPDTCHPPLGGEDFRDFKDPIDQHFTGPHAEHCRKMIGKAYDGATMYDLALAAFTEFGNCELARIALQRGVKQNPIVLKMIILRKPPPKDYNRTPRSMNGPEMAQDYLYLSQEPWTEPAAFAFASADPDVRAGTLKECHECKKKEAANGEHKRCAACKLAVYCSSECQKKNWAENKTACKKEQQFVKLMQSSNWT